jgi:hypothetical protein
MGYHQKRVMGMNYPNSRTTRQLEFVTALYPWAHGHQKKGPGDFAGALLEIKSCTQAKLAGAFENKVAAVKRLTRLLHHNRLRTEALAEGVAQQCLAPLGKLTLLPPVARAGFFALLPRVATDATKGKTSPVVPVAFRSCTTGSGLFSGAFLLGCFVGAPIEWGSFFEKRKQIHQTSLKSLS